MKKDVTEIILPLLGFDAHSDTKDTATPSFEAYHISYSVSEAALFKVSNFIAAAYDVTLLS